MSSKNVVAKIAQPYAEALEFFYKSIIFYSIILVFSINRYLNWDRILLLFIGINNLLDVYIWTKSIYCIV